MNHECQEALAKVHRECTENPNMLSDEMIHDLVNGLRKIFSDSISQIILYGSVARHEETSESDIDIAIIIEEAPVSDIRDRFIEWNSEMDMKYNIVFSIVDIVKAQMDKWGNVLPFYKNIKEEGIVLWKSAARKDSVEKSAEFLCMENQSS